VSSSYLETYNFLRGIAASSVVTMKLRRIAFVGVGIPKFLSTWLSGTRLSGQRGLFLGDT
jgi:hypothetical protein